MSADKHLVVNDFLAFLQEKEKLQAEGRLDAVTAVELSSRASSFTVEDICTAKQVLCESLGIVGTYVPHRKGDETGKKSLADILKILRENVGKTPEFVPEKLDVRRLFKDIVALKTSLAEITKKFDAAQVTIAELRNEVNSLRNASPQSVASNFGADDQRAPTNAESTHSQVADVVKRAAPAAAPRARPPRVRPPQVSSSCRRAYADVAGQPVAAGRPGLPSKVNELRVPGKEMSSRTIVDKEGFTLVKRKHKAPRKTLCGNAEPVTSGLRIATPSKALYVSRLHYSAVADDVVEYVRRKTGYSLKVHQLQSRHYVHFSSFVVRVPRPLEGTIVSADFWPKGIVFRRFRGKLPTPTPDLTTQRCHAVKSPKIT